MGPNNVQVFSLYLSLVGWPAREGGPFSSKPRRLRGLPAVLSERHGKRNLGARVVFEVAAGMATKISRAGSTGTH